MLLIANESEVLLIAVICTQAKLSISNLLLIAGKIYFE